MSKTQADELNALLADSGLNARQRARVRARVAKLGKIDWEKLVAFIKWLISLFKGL